VPFSEPLQQILLFSWIIALLILYAQLILSFRSQILREAFLAT
jgi:hypothetical protein